MNNERKTFYTFAVFAALFLTGCASIFFSTLNLQHVTVVADDDDAYDFYVNGILKCENTNECDFYRSTISRCQLTIEAKIDEVVLGTEKYGYWKEYPFIEQMFRNKDDDEKEKKCPEGLFSGAQAVVKIDQETKKRMNAARERAWLKKSETQWETSSLRSNSAE
jgi:hypothetical protein